jgi:formate hydrogenlyase transcriptional activator
MNRIAPVLEVVRAIARSRDRRELFDALGRTIRSIVPSFMVGLLVQVDDEQFVQVYVDPPLIAQIPRRLDDYPGTRAFRRGRAEVYRRADLAEFPHARKLWDDAGIGASLVIPLIVEERSIGAIINWTKDPDGYRDLDDDVLLALARAVAPAVDRVLAYEALKELLDQAADDHEVLTGEWRLVQIGDDVIGDDPEFRKLKRQLELVAPTTATVLLLGESGTGKDVLARAIHDASPRADHPMITINCAALPSTLAESELFGHEQGAFTGALKQRRGKFELADHGTLFLDEVGELPLDVQAKLLRVLQERELERVGGTDTIQVDVRIVAATNRDLEADVAAGRFREDLYYRLSVFPLALPPLRERRGDIPALVEVFIARAAVRLRVPVRRVTDEGMRRLTDYAWPGNVRELQNAIERAMIVSPGATLEVDAMLPRRAPVIAAAPPRPAPRTAPEDSDADVAARERYLAALEGCNWVIEGASGAAAILGVHPNTLRYRLKRLGITRPTR